MSTFDRYVAGQLLTYFGFFSLVLVAVFWVNRAIGLFDRLIAGGSNLGTFLEFTVLALPNVIVAVLPVAALVATLYGLNRLFSDSEIIVAQTAGVSPWGLARPVVIFGLVVALMVSILAHFLVPQSRAALTDRTIAVGQDVTARFLKAGEFLHPGTGVTVYVREITETGELLGLFLQDRRGGDVRTTYTAERAILVRATEGTHLVMFEGMAQSLQTDTLSLVTTTFDDFAYDLAGLAGQTEARAPMARELPTLTLLRASPATQAQTGASKAVLLFEGNSRFSDALFALAVPILALSILLIGGYSRMGLWRQIFAAVVAAIFFEMLGSFAETRAEESAALWWALYVPPLLTIAVAGALLLRDSRGPMTRTVRAVT